MKASTFLLLLFFSSFAAFGQSIELHQPSKRLCTGSENVLYFSLTGDFPSDETFNLYFVLTSEPYLLLDSAKSSPIKFTPAAGYHTLIIESTKTKIRSNIIYVGNYVHDYVTVDYTTTKACNGSSVKLDVWPVLKYDKIEWLKDGKVIEGANDYSYQAAESGSYFVRVIQEGCVSADSVDGHVKVEIGELEKPRIIPYTSWAVCDEFGVDLSISSELNNANYQWRFNGIDIPGANEKHYLAKKTGNFSVKIKQGNCEVIADPYKAIVGELEVSSLRINPYNQLKNNVIEICDGQEVTFDNMQYLDHKRGGKDFLEGIKYQWQKDGSDIDGANRDTYKTKEAGSYRLKITQAHCITFSENFIVKKIHKLNAIQFHGFKKEFCLGEEMAGNVSWDARAFGYNLSFKIYRDNQFFKEVNRNSDFIIKESGNYHAVASFSTPNNVATCAMLSDTITVVAKEKVANYSINSTLPTSTCLDSLSLNAWSYGTNDNPKHQWKLNGIALPNANKGYVAAKETGIYQLETQVDGGCMYLSNPVKIEFNKLDVKLSKYFPTCYDSLYLYPNIYSTLSYYDFNWWITNSKPTSYEWQLNNKTISNNYNQLLVSSGTYKFIVKQGTCIATDSIKVDASEIQVNIPKTLSPNQDSLFICPNGAVSIEAAKGDYSYMWLKDNQGFDNNQSQAIKVSAQGTYRAWIEKEGCGRISDAVVVKEKIVLPTALISGSKELMHGDSAKIKVDFTSLPPWAFKLTNNQEFTANTTPFEFAVKPEQTTVYELASVKNDCGEGTVSGKAEIRIIILGNEELAGAKVKLFPVPTQGICHLSVETVVPEKLGFQLYNVEGKILMQTQENQVNLAFKELINLESLPDGVYLLKIKVGDKLLSRKIIKGN
ncbi:T9SS type A sorting domain-containing protein [Emticicia soli]|uniref:T9SS type A sorting domain-containing protein n=1 Tax=Emticicia soli TaxID=2027878 RepID=A0ABW5JD11_9BACT